MKRSGPISELRREDENQVKEKKDFGNQLDPRIKTNS